MKTKIALLLLVTHGLAFGDNIKPLYIDKTLTSGGNAPRNFIVVFTTIQKNPDENDSKPIVERSVLGKIPTGISKQLQVPQQLTDIQGENGINVVQMTDMISKTVGAIGAAVPDPKVQAAMAATSLAVGTLGVIVDEGLKITGKIMDKIFGKQNSLISLIEILPEDYYTIDTTTGKVSVTKQWEADLETLLDLQKQYQPALQAFKDAALKYNKALNQAEIDDPYSQNDALTDSLNQMYQDLTPLAEAKLKIEVQLANLTLYRFALAPFNAPQLGTCAGEGSGPCDVRLFVFLGAKQTNLYDIPYCVANPNEYSHANIKVVLAGHYNKGVYTDGGIKLESGGNISFQGLTASGDLAFGFPSSQQYNWYDTMLTTGEDEGAGFEQYMVPFDINKLKSDLEAAKKAADEEHDTKTSEVLDQHLNAYMYSMGKASSEGFIGFGKNVSFEQEPAVEETAPAPEQEPAAEEAKPVAEEAKPTAEETKPLAEEAKPVAETVKIGSERAKPAAQKWVPGNIKEKGSAALGKIKQISEKASDVLTKLQAITK